MRFIILLFLIIDPFLLIGKWDLKLAEANINLINSAAFHVSPSDQQENILEVNELYLKNAYYEFKKDTVFWTDVNPNKKEVVLKRGKWHIMGDTLRIYDYDKIHTYNFLLKMSSSKSEIDLRIIFPNKDIARSKSTFIKGK